MFRLGDIRMDFILIFHLTNYSHNKGRCCEARYDSNFVTVSRDLDIDGMSQPLLGSLN